MVLLVGLAASPVAAQPQPSAPIAAGTPCQLASVLLKQMASAQGVVIYDAEPFKPMPARAGHRSPEPPAGVAADLADRWNATETTNVLQACPGIQPAGLRLATDTDRAATRGIQHGPSLHQMSAPIANAAGDHVLIELRQRCAQLCGAGELRHYKKTPKGWVELPKVGLWLS